VTFHVFCFVAHVFANNGLTV